jgi:dolichol-phosphate mannosyltransferase
MGCGDNELHLAVVEDGSVREIMPVQSLVVVVPVYNEEESLPSLFAGLHDLRQSLIGRRLRVVFVDDHSDDQSSALIRQACAENDWFSFVRLARRSGSHVAVIAGFEQCEEDCAVFIAADLQDPPQLLPRMVDLCDQGYDVVWGVRDGNDTRNAFDATASRLFYVLMHALLRSRDLPRKATFALLSRRAYRRLVRECSQQPILHVNIPQLGYSAASVIFRKPPRQAGHSKWTFIRKVGALYGAIVSAVRPPQEIRRPLYYIEDRGGLPARVGDGT